MMEAARRIGRDFQAPTKWSQLLEEAGFVDIDIKWVNWPIGSWAKGDKNKLMGRLTFENFYAGTYVTVPLFSALGWSPEKTRAVLEAARVEMMEQRVLLYQRVGFCYARKPETA
jgi:hypothetical protein